MPWSHRDNELHWWFRALNHILKKNSTSLYNPMITALYDAVRVICLTAFRRSPDSRGRWVPPLSWSIMACQWQILLFLVSVAMHVLEMEKKRARSTDSRPSRQNCSRCQHFEHPDPSGVGFWNLTKCTEGRILESGPRLLLPSVVDRSALILSVRRSLSWTERKLLLHPHSHWWFHRTLISSTSPAGQPTTGE